MKKYVVVIAVIAMIIAAGVFACNRSKSYEPEVWEIPESSETPKP